MDNTIWAVSADGSIRFQQLTSEYLDEAVDMMVEAFYTNENVCKAIAIAEDPKAIAEIKEVTRIAARDGVTVIAVDKSKNKVLGASFNSLQVKHKVGENPLEILARIWTQPKALATLKFIEETEGLCDLFDLCKVDCFLEIMFVGMLPEYRGRGIAKKLCEVSLEIGRKLHAGVNVKVAVDGSELSLEPVPQAAYSIFTSFITQRIGEQLGFSVAATRSYELYEFEGRSFASVIGNHTSSVMLEYIKFK